MAKLFTNDTLSGADAAAVGTLMADRIRDDLVIHPGWDLVEEYTNTAMRWYVFKCRSDISLLPRDFFVVMGRVIATGQLGFFITESYNSSTHTMQYFYKNIFNSPCTFDANGRETGTYVLGAALPSNTHLNPKTQSWTPSGTATKYWLIADDDIVTIAFNGASNSFMRFGAFEPLSSLDWEMPLMAISGDSIGLGGFTSNPAVASLTNTAFNAFSMHGGEGTVPGAGAGAVLGFQGPLTANDKLQGNMRPVAEVGIVMYTAFGSAADVVGYAAGKQKGMRWSPGNTMPPSMAFGDAFAMSGRLWIPAHPTDTRIYDTGVASI